MSGQARRGRARGWRPTVAAARGVSLLLTLIATIVLAGCSASGGSSGIDYTLGLQGSTADNPAQPPKIAANGPDGEYAFVYDNQVWAHVQGASAAVQVTHLTLSNGSTIIWGPLIWSPSGKSLAFSIVQNATPNQPSSSAGPLYYVNLSSCLTTSGATCPVYQTQLTGSVYGHSYDWLNDDWLIAGSGGGIEAFDISDPNGWRTWQLRTTATETQDGNCGQPRSYGDVEVVGTTLYYTCMNLSHLGATGAIGTASLNAASLSSIVNDFGADQTTRDEQIATLLNGDGLSGYQITSLGNVYMGATSVVAGAWQVNNSALVYENVGSIDTQHGTAARAICTTSVYNGGCGSTSLPNVPAQPLSVRPTVSLGSGSSIAYQGDALYLSGQKSSVAVTSPYAPDVLSGGAVAATNVVSTTTDASGVTHVTANLVIVQNGTPTTLIAGASDMAAR